jgi:dihydroneopterin aldolase
MTIDLSSCITVELCHAHFYAHHGVMAAENVVGNEFIVDVSASYPIKGDSIDDVIDSTVSYADIYDIVAQEMSIISAILEHVAWRIAKKIFDTFPILTNVNVRIEKVAPPITGIDGSAAASIQLRR